MVVGHQKQWQFLKKVAELGKVPHAYLFYGQDSIGKKKLALEFIKLLNCQKEVFDKRPCQNCRSCQDIEKKVFPDLFIIEPQDNKEIKIGQIRELHSHLALRSYLSPFKSVIIDQAHYLNQDAQSSFLKLLEEPRGKTIFILITEYPEMLLSTILSRLELLRFSPIPRSELKDYLKSRGVSGEKAESLLSLSSGKPGRALNFLLDPSKKDYQQKRIKEIWQISRSDLVVRFRYAKELAEDPQNLKEVLEIWLRYFREVLLSHLRQGSGGQAKDYSLTKLRKILKTIQTTNFLISTTNVNPRLALEIIMLEL